MPALINLKTDLTKLKANAQAFNKSITAESIDLLDLRTDMTMLKFGNDEPGYGSSGLPYIQTYVPPVPNLLNAKGPGFPLFTPGTTGNLDYPIRGGQIAFQIGQQTYTLSSQIDSVRIAKFLKDPKRGTLFVQKQIGLQLSNPKIETGNTLFGFQQDTPIPGLLENTRVYNDGRNTLAQVKAMGTGAHALRHGLVPFANYQKHYYATVNEQNINNTVSTNRLVNLNALKMTTSVSPFVNPENVLDINLVNTLGISLNRNFLFQYLGGPGSTYGVGPTNIRRSVDTTKLRSSTAMTYDQLKSQSSSNQSIVVSSNEGETSVSFIPKTTYKLKDFRTGLEGLEGSYRPWGNKTVDKRFYVSSGNYKDKMNTLSSFVFKNDVAPWEYNKERTDDLIKFVFEAISNDNPDYSTAIFFRAFLTAGITDNNSATLNAFKYLGRGENFYTYQGFDRTVAFSFRIAAGSKEELKPLYNKLNNLISQVYPDYSPTTSIMRAPLVRITIGDYLYRMPGFLESVNVTVDNNTPWEINLDGDSAQLPQVVDVSVSFKPILSELPSRSTFNAEKLISDNTIIDPEDSNEYKTQVKTFTAKQNNTALIANNGSFIDKNTETVATLKTSISQEQAFRNITPKFSPTIKNPLDIYTEKTGEELDNFLFTGGFKNN